MAEHINPKCGRYNNYFIAVILTIIIVAFALYMYYFMKGKNYDRNNCIIKYALIILVIVLGIWLFVDFFCG